MADALEVAPETLPALLSVRELTVAFGLPQARLRPVERVSFQLAAGETLGIVGESGSGKSSLGLALMGMAPSATAATLEGSVAFDGRDLLSLSPADLRRLRGRDMAMILQDPMVSLNPVLRIGTQIAEAITAHTSTPRRAVPDAVIRALAAVGIPAPEMRARAYPHMLSGGMRQRVVGAAALAGNPRLLIADEPTTALDPTVQARFLDWLEETQAATGMALIFITHDFGVVARLCARVAVMYAGEIVETAPVRDIFRRPAHWYTHALIDAVPKLAKTSARLATIPGQPPRLDARPAGCRFAPRCPRAESACAAPPPEVSLSPGRTVRCWFPHGGER